MFGFIKKIFKKKSTLSEDVQLYFNQIFAGTPSEQAMLQREAEALVIEYNMRELLEVLKSNSYPSNGSEQQLLDKLYGAADVLSTYDIQLLNRLKQQIKDEQISIAENSISKLR